MGTSRTSTNSKAAQLSQRTKDVRAVRRAQQKRAGLLPSYRFRAVRMPDRRKQAQRDACRTTVRDDEIG